MITVRLEVHNIRGYENGPGEKDYQADISKEQDTRIYY
jgi:hypothetical protein